MAVRTRLEQWRRSQFFSVRELARRAGVKPNTISDIENGKTTLPKRDTMKKLADALGISIEDLADESPSPRMPRPAA